MATDSRLAGKNINKDRNKMDFYPTPYTMTEALFKIEKFNGNVWEPACGEGHMSEIIKKYNICHNSDVIIPKRKIENFKQINYLNEFETMDLKYDNIITNPPFGAALEFLLKSKEMARYKIAFLLRLEYLHGIERYKKVYQDKIFPLKTVAVFVRRPMLDGVNIDKPYGTGMLTFAWFIWECRYKERPYIQWINNQKDIK